MRFVRKFFRVLFATIGVCAVLVAIGAVLAPFLLPLVEGTTSVGQATSAPTGPITGDPYRGDPNIEPKLVSAEGARVAEVRSAAASAIGAGVTGSSVFRVLTKPRPTLVLPERAEPYTLAELAAMAPESIQITPDGAYLVVEPLVVVQGATLKVTAGQRVQLASDASGFSSIVTVGGTLDIQGTKDQRVQITSWNTQSGAPDTTTNDGRAYVRVDEGVATLSNAQFSDLGFWSGPTGGLALVGEQHANVEPAPAVKSQEGTVAVPLQASPVPHLVRADLSSLTIAGNAYGIYVTRAESLSLRDSAVTGSLVDGIVLDEGVKAATVTSTTSSENAVDGLVASQTAGGLTLHDLDASQNGRNGVTLEGTPLAEGPNASGDTVTSFGGYSVRGGTFTGNSRYGIEVRGVIGAKVSGATISGGDMGLVLSHAPRRVTITDNVIQDAHRHGIAVRDRASNVRVSGNHITGGDVGIYLRSSEVSVEQNTIKDSSQYGITAVGSMHGSKLLGNQISGTGAGATAINAEHASRVSVEKNLVDGWVTSRSLQQILATIFQPLTILWSGILAVVALAIFWRLGRGPRRIRAEAEHAPLQSMSRGVFDRDTAKELTL
ncbi:MAG TPA: right-handed parallel beta-helix repeat-containing protein [Pseudolysinimonas sp.]|nr:right-handed parallel beta-helix repeat-containing protein [Pseudolysinimonas sp.]